MAQFKINGLRHIQLAMPQGREDDAREFYIGVLGLVEESKPDQLKGRGGVWFIGNGVALHLGVEDPFIPAKKAHPAFEVDDLMQARTELAQFDPTQISELPGLKRFYIADPFGNRIEILQLL